MSSKVCTKCHIDKPFSEYSKCKNGKYGLKSYCSSCAKAYRRVAQPITVEEKLCKCCNTVKLADEFHRCLSDKTGLQAKCKECAKPNGTRKEYLRDYYKENKERLNAYGREYQKSDKGKAVTKNTKYRRKLQMPQDKVLSEQIKIIVFKVPTCYWCGELLDSSRQLDHYYPLSTGGSHAVSNFVTACQPCNRTKSNKNPSDFAREIYKVFGRDNLGYVVLNYTN